MNASRLPLSLYWAGGYHQPRRCVHVAAQCASRAAPSFGKPRRVVVTGIGLVTPVGVGVDHAWQGLMDGKSGLVQLQDDGFATLPSRVAGKVPVGTNPGEYHAADWLEPSEARRLPTGIQYGLTAAKLALIDAGWSEDAQEAGTSPFDPLRTGVAIGTGISGAEDLLAGHDALNDRGYRRVSPYLVPNSLVNMTAGLVSIKYNFQGPNHAVSTACATGAHSVGDAFRLVSLGDADVMVCGASDACIVPIVVAGFCRVKALATTFNDDPATASRPFDENRGGFVIGEGAAVLVLESLEHATARGADIYAEVRGYGLTADAHHITQPAADGRGAVRAMKAALSQAGVAPDEVGYVNAHATSTPQGDILELQSIEKVFGKERESPLMVSSTKGAMGHLLGAAGAAEAAFTVLALKHGRVPPTLNLETQEAGFGLDLVPQVPKEAVLKAALSNSFGFGGTNASLCFTSYNDAV